MFCRHCGNKLDDSAKVCPACGTTVIVPDENNTKADVKPAEPEKPAAPAKKRAIRHIDPAQRMAGYNRNQPSMGPVQIKAEPDAIPSVEPIKAEPAPQAEKPAEKPAGSSQKKRAIRHIDPSERYNRNQPSMGPVQIKAEPDAIPSVGAPKAQPAPEAPKQETKPVTPKPAPEAKKEPVKAETAKPAPETKKEPVKAETAKPAPVPETKSDNKKHPELGKILENAGDIKPAASPFESLNQPKEKSEPQKNPELGKILENAGDIKPAASPFESLNQPKEKSEPQKNPELGKILENAGDIKPAASPFESLNQPKEKSEPQKNPELGKILENAGDIKPAASPFESLNQPKEKSEPQKNPELGKILENAGDIKPAASPFESLNQPKEKSEPQKNPELGKILENAGDIKPAASPFESLNQPKEKSEPQKNPELGKILENAGDIKPAASPFESLNQPKEKTEPQKNPELGKILENAGDIKPAASPFESLNQPKEKSEPQKNPELGKILENAGDIKPAASPFESLNQPKEKSEPQKNPELGKILENAGDIKPAASPFPSLNQPETIRPETIQPETIRPETVQPENKAEAPEPPEQKPVEQQPVEQQPAEQKPADPIKTDKTPEPVKVSEIDEIIDNFGSSPERNDSASEKKSDAEIDGIIDNIKPSVVPPRPAPEPDQYAPVRPAPERLERLDKPTAPQGSAYERPQRNTESHARPTAEENPFRRTPPPAPSAQSSSSSARPVKKKGGKKVGIIIGAAAGAVLIGGAGVGYFGFHNDITRMTMGDKEYARMISRQAIKDIIPADGTSDRFAGYAAGALSGAANTSDASVTDIVSKTGALSGIFDTIPTGKSISFEAKLKVKPGKIFGLDSESAQKFADTLGSAAVTGKLVNGDTDLISIGIKDAEGKSGSAEIYCKGSDVVVAFPGMTDKTVAFSKDDLGGISTGFDRGSFKNLCSDTAKIFFDSFDSAEMSFSKGVEQSHDFSCGKTELSAKTSGSEIKATFTAAQVGTMLGKVKDLLTASPDTANTLNGYFMMFGVDVNEALDSLADGSTTLTVRHLTDVHNNILATCISFDRADGTTAAELKNTKQEGLEITSLSYKDVSAALAKKVRVGTDGNAYISVKNGGSEIAFDVEYTGMKTKEFLGTEVLTGKYIIKLAEGSAAAESLKNNPIFASLVPAGDASADLSKFTLTYDSTVTGSTHTVSFDLSAGTLGTFGFTIRADEGSDSVSMPDASAAVKGTDSNAASGVIDDVMAWLAGEAAEVDGGNGIVSGLVDYDPNKHFIEHFSAYDENSRDKASAYAETISANLAEHISAAIAADSEASGTIKLYFINGKCMVIDPAGIEGIDLDHLGLSSVYAEAYYDGTVSDTIAGVTVVLTDSAGDLPDNLPEIRDFTYGVYPWGSNAHIGYIGSFVVGTCPILPDGEAPADIIDSDGDGEPDTDTDTDIDEPGTDTDGDGDIDEDDTPVTTTPAVTTAKPVTTKPVETTDSDSGSSTDFGAVKKNPDISDVVGVWEGKSKTYAICSNYIMTPYSEGTLSNTDFMVLKSTKNGFDIYEKGKTKTGSLSYSAKTDSIKLELNGKETILAKKKSGTKMSYMGNWTLYTYEGLTSSQYCQEYNETAAGFAMNLSIGEFSAVITNSKKSEIYSISKIKSGSCRLTYNSWTYFDVTYDGSGKLTLTQHYSDSSDTQEFVFIKGSYKF